MRTLTKQKENTPIVSLLIKCWRIMLFIFPFILIFITHISLHILPPLLRILFSTNYLKPWYYEHLLCNPTPSDFSNLIYSCTNQPGSLGILPTSSESCLCIFTQTALLLLLFIIQPTFQGQANSAPGVWLLFPSLKTKLLLGEQRCWCQQLWISVPDPPLSCQVSSASYWNSSVHLIYSPLKKHIVVPTS